MNKLHYYYTFPTTISIATAISFLIKGEWFLPLFIYTLYAWWSYLIMNLIVHLIYTVLKKTRVFNGVERFLTHYMEKNKWIEKADNESFIKGRYYKGFKESIKYFYYDDFNASELVKIFNALLFGVLITVCLTPLNLPKFVLVFTICYYILFVLSSLFLYAVIDKQSFVEDIVDKIDREDKSGSK